MSQQYYSVDQVANLLDLHVRTVRAYVRDGRLKATRIGKQYRIAREDFEAFTGAPTASVARAKPYAEASIIVQVNPISTESSNRLVNTLMAATASRQSSAGLRVETVYDIERANLKVVVLGPLDSSAELLKIISALIEE